MKSLLNSVGRNSGFALTLALVALTASVRAQTIGSDHLTFSGNETLGSGRIDTNGILIFEGNSTAANGQIFGRGSTRIFFRGNATAGNATISTSSATGADRNIVSFAENATAGTATVYGNYYSDVEFIDRADGPQLRVAFAQGLDISGASTGTGTTGRTRATTLVRTPVSVVADDARTVSVGYASVQSLGLGSNNLQIGAGYLGYITDVGVFQSASGRTMTGGGIIKVGPETLTLGWDYAAVPYAVPLEIRGGRVESYRRFLGNVTVGSAGTLILWSAVNGNLTNSGRLETYFGNNTAIAGNFSQTPGGAIVVPSAFLGGYSLPPALAINGPASLAGRLEVNETGYFNLLYLSQNLPVSRTLLTATSVNGRFDTVVLNAPARLHLTPQYLPTSVRLDFSLRPYADFGVTPAGLAMAGHFDAFANNPFGATDYLRSFILQINAGTAPALTAALESLVPDVYGAAFDGAVQSGHALRKAVAQPMAALKGRPKGFTTMFAGNSRRARFDAAQGLPEARESSAGGMFGLIGTFSELSAGLFVAQENADTELDQKGGAVERETQNAALSVRYKNRGFHAQASAGAGRGEADLRRLVGTPGQGPLVRGSTDTDLRFYAGEVGYSLDKGRWHLGASAGYSSTTVKWDDFTETNGFGSELTLNGLDFDSRQLHAGVQAAIRVARERLRLRVALTAVRELEENRTFLARLAGAPAGTGFYRAPGRSADRDALEAGLEAEWHITPNLVFSASYAGARGDHSRVTGDFSAGFRWSF
jgi:hypothetical protein